MNTSFGDSNLFQTLVLIVTIGATTGIALWQFHAHKRKELRNAVSILILQIKDIEKNIEYIEKNIEYIFSEGIINGIIQKTENKAFYYYNAIYNQIVIANQPLQNIQSIMDRFNEAVVPSYLQKELALGLEKTLKQYHKLTDGIA